MSTIPSPLISTRDLAHAGNGLIIIDARSGPDGPDRFKNGHLRDAIHVDLDKDLSERSSDPAQGGRHPLPSINRFAKFLGKIGITPQSHVVVYDDKNAANAAARFWWMLRAVGHERIHVVDGGMDAIVKNGIPLTTEIKSPTAVTEYPVTDWKLPTVDLNQVTQAVNRHDKLVIDVRESYRYRGEKEPIDLIAGHIPGAINIPYLSNLNVDGTFRSPAALRSDYEKVIGADGPQNVIVHCGSGVTACHTLLALEHAGIKGANLYVGSWSEWSRNDRPVATGEK